VAPLIGMDLLFGGRSTFNFKITGLYRVRMFQLISTYLRKVT